MAYEPLDFDDILQALLDDYRNRVPGADVSADSDPYIRCAVVAGAIWGLHYGLKYVEDQVFPDSADTDNLERHAATYEITRKAAVVADDGEIRLTGTESTVVASGLTVAHEDGTTYTTTSGGTITGGILDVTADCDTAGTIGNKSGGQDLTVQSPPAGVDSAAEVVTAFEAGADEETDAALLARLLVRIRQGNAGGTASDYEQWALSVAGCAFAYALPLRRGAGTVDVAICQADSEGVRTNPSASLRTAVLAYIDTVRPVTADVQVPVLTWVGIDVDVTLTVLDDGVEVADVTDAVTTAIEEVINAVEPGGTFYLTGLMRAISLVDGVIDFTISDPVANVVLTADDTIVEISEPGTITVA